ncbi:MAG TPA: GNAT family N-acetyltransferase [Phaeodactylibacter sp.]|nr:GNAT family N-acetyltransferase [Phaeodactylibacter sp.]
MGSAEQQTYGAFCESANVPDFNRPWWLDVVCGPGNWGVAMAEDKKGEIAAALPYFKSKVKGLPALRQPPLMPYMGLWRYPAYQQASVAKRFTLDRQLIPQLLKQLPRVVLHTQKLHPSTVNWLPFYWAGYQQQLRYHFIVPQLQDEQALYRNFNRSVKYSITHGPEQLEIVEGEDVASLFSLLTDTFDRQGLSLPITLDLVKRLDEAVQHNGRRQLLFAQHKGSGALHSGVFLLHTAGVSYPLMAGNGPGSRQTGAFQYLMWSCFRESAAYSRKFNFLGSVMPNVAPGLNGFRAVPIPYFEIYRAWPKALSPFVQWLI